MENSKNIEKLLNKEYYWYSLIEKWCINNENNRMDFKEIPLEIWFLRKEVEVKYYNNIVLKDPNSIVFRRWRYLTLNEMSIIFIVVSLKMDKLCALLRNDGKI